MTTMTAYDKLYMSMKNKFTVTADNCEYSLGEYMSKKANAKASSSSLPVAANKANQVSTISAIFTYVNDKLTVKREPVKDKTIRAFPFRTSLAECFSAVVACAFIFSFGIFSMKGASALPATADAEEIETVELESYNPSENG